MIFVDEGTGDLPSSSPAPGAGRWQHWRSPDGSVQSAFDVQVNPFAILIDHEGIIRAKGIVSAPQAIVDLSIRSGCPTQHR